MNLLRSEWRKLRTIRIWMALAVVAVGLTVVNVGTLIVLSGIELEGTPIPELSTPEAMRSVYGGAAGSAAFALVLGIISMTSEFRHQTITPTLLAAPRRGPMVAAKMAVAAAFAAVIGLACALATVAAVAIGVLVKDIGPVDVAVFAAVCGGVILGFAVYGVLGVAVGALVRNQIAAITGALIWTLLVESIVVSIWPSIGKWLPGGALNGVLQVQPPGGGEYLPVAAAAGVLLLYATALAGVAVRTTLRRDIT